MVRVIDLDDAGLTTEQVLESVRGADAVMLRREGRIIARLEPADEIDLQDEVWAHDPEQIKRGNEARDRLKRGEALSHDEIKRQLDT